MMRPAMLLEMPCCAGSPRRAGSRCARQTLSRDWEVMSLPSFLITAPRTAQDTLANNYCRHSTHWRPLSEGFHVGSAATFCRSTRRTCDFQRTLGNRLSLPPEVTDLQC